MLIPSLHHDDSETLGESKIKSSIFQKGTVPGTVSQKTVQGDRKSGTRLLKSEHKNSINPAQRNQSIMETSLKRKHFIVLNVRIPYNYTC